MEFKKEIKLMLTEEEFQTVLTEEIKGNFTDYLANYYTFFYDEAYKTEELNVLFTAINDYQIVLAKTHFTAKKRLLDYQVSLITK